MARRDMKGLKLSVHIWVQGIIPDALGSSGKPYGWDRLKQTLQGLVAMNQVSFLFVNWEKVNRETGHQRELKIKDALKKDIEDGLVFCQLPGPYPREAWWVLEGFVELKKAELKRGVNRMMRGEWESKRTDEAKERAKTAKKRDEEERRERAEEERKRAEENRIVNSMQRELIELLVELEKTEDGRLVQTKLERADTELRKFLEPMLAKIDGEGNKKAKERLQKEADEKYALHMRAFWGHFEEVRAMRIPIGPTLREFYGIGEVKPPKKRFGIF